MPATALDSAEAAPASTSLPAKLCNLLASPDDVFAEVAAAPASLPNWLIPTLLAGLAGMLATESSSDIAPWPRLLGAALGALAGTFWSAFVLWFIGRVFLDARFSFFKTLEVTGLTSIIPALGTVVTLLLIAVTGNQDARPAVWLLAGNWNLSPHLHDALDALNLFNLWGTGVLAVGLARLARVSFKAAAFWVFGYWICLRVALILLA